MVFKTLQIFPLGLKGFFIQVLYGLLSFLFISFFKENKSSFFLAFLFSQIYMFLFVSSLFFFFSENKKQIAFFLLFFKWVLLLCFLLLVFLFSQVDFAFLIGLTGFGSFLFCFILEKKRKGKNSY